MSRITNDENQHLATDTAKNAIKPGTLHTNLPYHGQGPSSSNARDPSTSYFMSSPESAPGLSGSSRTSSALESGLTTPEHRWAQGNAGFTLQQPESTVYQAEAYEDITSPSTVSHVVPPTSPLVSSLAQDFAYDQADPSRPLSQTTVRPVDTTIAIVSPREAPSGPRAPPTAAISSRRSWESLQNTPPIYYNESHWAEFRARRGLPEAGEDDDQQDDTPRPIPPDLREPYVDLDDELPPLESQSFFVPYEVDIRHPNVLNEAWMAEDQLEPDDASHMLAAHLHQEEDLHSDDSDVSSFDQRLNEAWMAEERLESDDANHLLAPHLHQEVYLHSDGSDVSSFDQGTLTGLNQSMEIVSGSEQQNPHDHDREPSPTHLEVLRLERQRVRQLQREATFADTAGDDILDQRTTSGPSRSYSLVEEDPDAILPCSPGNIIEDRDAAQPENTDQRIPISQDWNRLAALTMADDAAERARFNRFRDVAERFGVSDAAYGLVEHLFLIQPKERRERMIGSFLREYENSPWLSVGPEWCTSQPNEGAFDPNAPWSLSAYKMLRSWMSGATADSKGGLLKYLRERLVLSQDYSMELLECFRPCLDRSPPTRAEKIASAISTAANPKRAREKRRARATLSGEDPDSTANSPSNTLRRISESFNNKVSTPINRTIRTTTQKMGKSARQLGDSLDTLFHEFKDPVEDPSKYCEYCDNHGHEKPVCPHKRQKEIWARHTAQERAIKDMEARPGIFKDENYDVARLDKGPISEIKLDSPQKADSSNERRSIIYESLGGYKEMCTGCDEYGGSEDHVDHPIEFEAGPSKVDKGKGKAKDDAAPAPSSFGYPFGSFSGRTFCPICQESGHDKEYFEDSRAARWRASQQWQNENFMPQDYERSEDDNSKPKDKGKGRRRSEGSCKQQ